MHTKSETRMRNFCNTQLQKADPFIEEHHITGFDTATFFSLHDYDGLGIWSTSDIQRTYGLLDPSASHISDSEKKRVVDTVLKLFDTNADGVVSREEFENKSNAGVKLPDFGMGPGHHGDDEYVWPTYNKANADFGCKV
jgi:hypothetical protein